MYFPGVQTTVNNKFSVTVLYILANYLSPMVIANKNVCSYDFLRRKSHGKFTFVKLKELAKNTVGVNTDCYRVEFEILTTLSIKGIGLVLTTVIISELSDISRFATLVKVLSFAVYYRKKISDAKPLSVAISHVAKKLMRFIFALETKGVSFDPTRFR